MEGITIGKHYLSGVERGVEIATNGYDSDADTLSFILDGEVYTVIENPDDGYRSSMRELIKSDAKISNTFPPIEVLVIEREDSNYESCDILDFIDVITGKIILSIGTDNTDDWYPCFVANWSPEDMCLNQK